MIKQFIKKYRINNKIYPLIKIIKIRTKHQIPLLKKTTMPANLESECPLLAAFAMS